MFNKNTYSSFCVVMNLSAISAPARITPPIKNEITEFFTKPAMINVMKEIPAQRSAYGIWLET